MSIIGDSKDWSWVLQRRCPECGFAAAEFDPELAGGRIRADADRWREILGRRDAGVRPSASSWSATEYACHVRDVADLFGRRLARMLTEDNPQFANWDQDQVALDDDYAAQSAAAVSVEVAYSLSRLADAFDLVSGANWQRPGGRAGGLNFTVRTLAQYFLHDEIHHLHDVNG